MTRPIHPPGSYALAAKMQRIARAAAHDRRIRRRAVQQQEAALQASTDAPRVIPVLADFGPTVAQLKARK